MLCECSERGEEIGQLDCSVHDPPSVLPLGA